MLRNIFTLTVRNLFKNPLNSFINVTGLAVGFTSALLITLWVLHERSFDRFHHEPDQLYKVITHVTADGTVNTYDVAPGGLDLSSLPEVTEVVQVWSGQRWPNELCFRSETQPDACVYLNGMYASPAFFTVFNFPIIKGNPNPLSDISSIAISEKMATRLYGNEDPIGKTFKIDTWIDVTVASVFQNPPVHSTLQFDFVMPFHVVKKLRGFNDQTFATNFIQTYFKTATKIPQEELTARLNTQSVLTEEYKNQGLAYMAYPFTDWRLKNKFENGQAAGGRITYVHLFMGIGILIVIMAAINFVNLSTARASTRSKEIGIRKVSGALRHQLVVQFLGESTLLVVFAALVAVGITHLVLPLFNLITTEQISFSFTGPFAYYLGVVVLVIALLSGGYPAVVLSAFQPAAVLKNRISTTANPSQLRKFLLTVQVAVSIGIIIFSLVLSNQLDFISTKNLGFDREHMIRLEPTYGLLKQFDAFKTELLKNPNIKSVTTANGNPLNHSGHNWDVSWPGKAPETKISFQALGVGEEFPETFGLQLVAGEWFTGNHRDSLYHPVLVSEHAIKVMGLSNPIGAKLKISDSDCMITGVVRDFHTESLHKSMEPVILYQWPRLNSSMIFIKYESGIASEVVEGIDAVYKKFESSFSMKYWFQDETFEQLYKSEFTAQRLILAFTGIALIISLLGIVGLATYNLLRRVKEIGIRRVFGASLTQILYLISTEFLLIILIAAGVVAPVAWYASEQWLNTFAYRIETPWWIYGVTILGMIVVTVITISLQSLKTIQTNPTQTLRSE